LEFLLCLQEKEDQKKLKQKQKDRMQPKMGKMDIDYQVLGAAPVLWRTLLPVPGRLSTLESFV